MKEKRLRFFDYEKQIIKKREDSGISCICSIAELFYNSKIKTAMNLNVLNAVNITPCYSKRSNNYVSKDISEGVIKTESTSSNSAKNSVQSTTFRLNLGQHRLFLITQKYNQESA